MIAREGNMGNCQPSKTNVNLGFASVDIGFLRVTFSYVTLSCSQYLYNIHSTVSNTLSKSTSKMRPGIFLMFVYFNKICNCFGIFSDISFFFYKNCLIRINYIWQKLFYSCCQLQKVAKHNLAQRS